MADQACSDVTPLVYNAENDIHMYAIDGLVHELGIAAEVVNGHYRQALEEFTVIVSRRSMLPLIVSRAVKERLVQQYYSSSYRSGAAP